MITAIFVLSIINVALGAIAVWQRERTIRGMKK